jgi:myosin I
MAATFASTAGVDDMVMLTDISNSGINSNLHKRFDKNTIYTYIGHVLISVNPYKLFPVLYEDRTLKDYKGKYRYELPPHVFSLADDMYRSMLSERENQCVIISGESGAGKTEAAKRIMQFIAAVAGAGAGVEHIKQVMLDSNPLLEAFGNAKTIRNDNSSRFGKYMEIQFDIAGDPEGGRISNYLLEKSRVVTRTAKERCFHIFYQLIAGADGGMQQDLGLSGPDYFCYLNVSGVYKVDGMDDVKEWQDMMHGMNTMGIDAATQAEVFKVLAGILYLGNVFFDKGAKGEDSVPQDPQVMDMVAHLFTTDSQSLNKSLCYRQITTGGSGARRASTYNCPNNVENAMYARDALSKAVYSRTFDWIVAQVNLALGWQQDPDYISLGILDIYGFEIFGQNGFEQFCINYVNERLQQIFIQLTLKAEQEEYAKEGIKWEDIPFFNNKICCDLIDQKRPPGLMALLDDTCNFPKGDDEKFLGKVSEAFNSHAHLTPMVGQGQFVLKHYAGDVTYTAEGFVDRNKDILNNDLVDLATCTSSSFYAGLFPECKQQADKRRPSTAAFKIRESINALVGALEICHPHYIRCIKPNEKKQPGNYDSGLCQHQVKYLGLLENVKVRRAGYAYRQFYDKFFYRYRVCSSQTWPNFSGDHKSGADMIMQVLNLSPGNGYEKGNNKIFIRAPESVFSLEELRERKVYNYANQIQRFFLRFSLSNYFYQIQKGANDQVVGKKDRRRLSFERPFSGDYIGYRDNFPLKGVVEANGKEKLVFGDRVNKYDRRMKAQRRIFLITDQAAYLISIEKNKDKDKIRRAQKPWVYEEKRRIPLAQLRSFTFSTKADNFVMMQGGEYDTLFETRRKIELIGVLNKYASNISFQFTDNMQVAIKGGKKKYAVQFVADPSAPDGKVKGKKVAVAPGLDKNSAPNIPEPVSVPTIANTDPYGGLRGPGGGGGGGRGGRGGAPRGGAAPRGGGPSSFGGGGGAAKDQCKALYDFAAENPDELSFATGDIIDITDSSAPDWWQGSCNGASGIFPANYVEKVAAAAPAAAPRGRGGPPGGAPRGRGGPPAGRGGPPRGRGGPPGGRGARGAPRGGPRGGPARGRGRGMPPPRGRAF